MYDFFRDLLEEARQCLQSNFKWEGFYLTSWEVQNVVREMLTMYTELGMGLAPG